MCGIFGFSRLTPFARSAAHILGWEMVKRGGDAWGMSNGIDVRRFPGPLVGGWDEPPAEWDDLPLIVHTRGASFRDNASDPKCAHPYTFPREDGTSIIGIHNGVVRNWEELNKKYGRSFPVDSMHIFAHRAEGRPWSDLYGWGNIAWFETSPKGDQFLHLVRINDGALHAVTFADGTLAFASTKEPLLWVGRMFRNPVKETWELKEYNHYLVGADETGERDILWHVDGEKELRFGGGWPSTAAAGTGTEYLSRSTPGGVRLLEGPAKNGTAKDTCVPCRGCWAAGSALTSYTNALFCEECFAKEVEIFLQNQQMEQELNEMFRRRHQLPAQEPENPSKVVQIGCGLAVLTDEEDKELWAEESEEQKWMN